MQQQTITFNTAQKFINLDALTQLTDFTTAVAAYQAAPPTPPSPLGDTATAMAAAITAAQAVPTTINISGAINGTATVSLVLFQEIKAALPALQSAFDDAEESGDDGDPLYPATQSFLTALMGLAGSSAVTVMLDEAGTAAPQQPAAV